MAAIASALSAWTSNTDPRSRRMASASCIWRAFSGGKSSEPEFARKHLKPSTPASWSGPRLPRLPGMTPPQKPTSTWHCPPAALRLMASASGVTVAGTLSSGMSTKVVTPPAAAALVAVAKPSHSVLPGSHRCTWGSMRPGSTTTSEPSSSTVRAVAGLSTGWRTSMRPLRTPMARACSGSPRSPDTTRSARMRSSRSTVPHLPAPDDLGHILHKPDRVGVLGSLEDAFDGTALDNLPFGQHGHRLGDGADQGQVVGDEQEGQVPLGLQAPQQLDDRRLHGHVEGGGDLVADQEVWGDHQGPGDGDPLALTARELVGVAGPEIGAEGDIGQHAGHPLVPLGAGQGRVEVVQGLLDDLADRLAGIQGGVWVLEDVLDGLEDLRPALLGGWGEILAPELHLA